MAVALRILQLDRAEFGSVFRENFGLREIFMVASVVARFP
jgi:hypothetical protein